MESSLEPGDPLYHQAKAVEFRTAANMLRNGEINTYRDLLDYFPEHILYIHEGMIRLELNKPTEEQNWDLIDQARTNIEALKKKIGMKDEEE